MNKFFIGRVGKVVQLTQDCPKVLFKLFDGQEEYEETCLFHPEQVSLQN